MKKWIIGCLVGLMVGGCSKVIDIDEVNSVTFIPANKDKTSWCYTPCDIKEVTTKKGRKARFVASVVDMYPGQSIVIVQDGASQEIVFKPISIGKKGK